MKAGFGPFQKLQLFRMLMTYYEDELPKHEHNLAQIAPPSPPQTNGHASSLGIRDGPDLLVRLEDVRDWSSRHNPQWVQHEMAGHVMFLDVLELCRLLEGRDVPVQIPQPAMDSGIAAADIADVAFEVLDIHRIEAGDGHVQAYVRFGDVGAEVVRALGSCGGLELRLGFVEVSEEFGHGAVVGFLAAGESGLAKEIG
jgi:hypothetical protein